MKSILLGTCALLLISVSAFAGDISITFSPDTEVYPPSADTATCQLYGTAACVIFSGTITDNDTDRSLLFLTGITLSDYNDYFTVDNNFTDNPLTGTFEGDTLNHVASNTYTGEIMGLDIASDTPLGTYSAEAVFSGFGGTNDPDDNGFTQNVDFTVVVTPEPITGGLTLIGLLALAASRRLRRTRPC